MVRLSFHLHAAFHQGEGGLNRPSEILMLLTRALYSFCTFAALEADLPGYVFMIVPLCNFGLQQTKSVKAAGWFLLYEVALHLCIKRVKDIASHFFRIS